MDSDKILLERFGRNIKFEKSITPLNFRILSYFQCDFHVNLFLFNFTTPKLLFMPQTVGIYHLAQHIAFPRYGVG